MSKAQKKEEPVDLTRNGDRLDNLETTMMKEAVAFTRKHPEIASEIFMAAAQQVAYRGTCLGETACHQAWHNVYEKNIPWHGQPCDTPPKFLPEGVLFKAMSASTVIKWMPNVQGEEPIQQFNKNCPDTEAQKDFKQSAYEILCSAYVRGFRKELEQNRLYYRNLPACETPL